MQDTGCSGLVHWDDPEGWYGEGGGGFRMGNMCIPVAYSKSEVLYIYFTTPHSMGVLVLQPRIEPSPLAVKA